MLPAIFCGFIVGSVRAGPLPNGQCSADDVTCELAGDNLLFIVNGVSGAEECRESLTAESGCAASKNPAEIPTTI